MTTCPDGPLRASIDGEADVPPAPRWRVRGARFAAATCLTLTVALVMTPGGRSAAAAFLAQFRTERLAVVTVDSGTAANLAAVERIGTVSGAPAEPQPVADLGEAERLTGLDVARPDPATLPAHVRGTPQILVAKASQMRLTFSRARSPEVPANLDGATLVINIPAMVLQQYGTLDDIRGLVVAEAGQLTADVEQPAGHARASRGDATLEEVRAFLLSLPDLPPDLTSQLRAITDWRSTLPIPVPAGQIAWRHTTVAGGPALLFGDDSGLGSAVLWQRHGRIHGVGGALEAGEVVRIAGRLRP